MRRRVKMSELWEYLGQLTEKPCEAEDRARLCILIGIVAHYEAERLGICPPLLPGLEFDATIRRAP